MEGKRTFAYRCFLSFCFFVVVVVVVVSFCFVSATYVSSIILFDSIISVIRAADKFSGIKRTFSRFLGTNID